MANMTPDQLFEPRGQGKILPPLADKIEVGDCWLWKGCVDSDGYGATSVRKRQWKAHRLFYETLVGPIPDGMTIDHLCRIKTCVNPDHLQPVSSVENVRRGFSPHAQNWRRREVCAKGHALVGDNVHVTAKGGRWCVTCRRDRDREAKRVMRAARKAERGL